jgi:hypothetical protein
MPPPSGFAPPQVAAIAAPPSITSVSTEIAATRASTDEVSLSTGLLRRLAASRSLSNRTEPRPPVAPYDFEAPNASTSRPSTGGPAGSRRARVTRAEVKASLSPRASAHLPFANLEHLGVAPGGQPPRPGSSPRSAPKEDQALARLRQAAADRLDKCDHPRAGSSTSAKPRTRSRHRGTVAIGSCPVAR